MSITSLKNISPLQEDIMIAINLWSKNQKTPIPKQTLITIFEKKSKKSFTVVSALKSLLHKGYIRRAYGMKTCYVQLKSV